MQHILYQQPYVVVEWNPYRAWEESYTLTQTETGDTLTLHIKRELLLERYWRSGGYFEFSLGDEKITSERFSDINHDWSVQETFYEDKTLSFPTEWVGQTINYKMWLGGAVLSSGSFLLDGYVQYSLAITQNDHITTTVERSASPYAEAELTELESGAAIYSGDVLEISAVADTGYAASEFETPITVSSDVTVSITASPMATASIWNGSVWQKYLIYLFGGGSWNLYQPYVYSNGQWSPYF